jgi:hypothetical protein
MGLSAFMLNWTIFLARARHISMGYMSALITRIRVLREK